MSRTCHCVWALLLVVEWCVFGSGDYTPWDIWSSDPNQPTGNGSAFNSTRRKYLLEGKLRYSASKGDLPLFSSTFALGSRENAFNAWAPDHNGRTWLHFAAIAGMGGDTIPLNGTSFLSEAFALTMKGLSTDATVRYANVRDASGQTPLHEAALNGHLNTFKALLTLDAYMFARALPLQGDFSLGWTMMNWLAANGPYRNPDVSGRASKVAALDQIIVNFQDDLINEKRKAPVFVDVSSMSDPDECTCNDVPLGCCLSYKSGVVDNINARYKCRGMTVLDYAVVKNRTSIVQYILKLQPSARYWKSNWCELPIHKAAQLGYTNLVKIFLDAENTASITCSSKSPPYLMSQISQGSETLIHLAAMGGHKGVLDTLNTYCPDLFATLLSKGAASGDTSYVWQGEKPCDLSKAAFGIIKTYCNAGQCNGRHRFYCTPTALIEDDRTPCLYDLDCMAIDQNSRCINLGEKMDFQNFTDHQYSCNLVCKGISTCT